MRFIVKETEREKLQNELQEALSKQEEVLAALHLELEEIQQKKHAHFCSIGKEAYNQYKLGSDVCNIEPIFLALSELDSEMILQEEKINQSTQTYQEEIATLEAQLKALLDVSPALVSEVPVETPAVAPQIPVIAPVITDPPAPPSPSFCDNCGKEMYQDDVFCQYCGARASHS